jgi:glycosyltransferase involved in cell wall biosynthesis
VQPAGVDTDLHRQTVPLPAVRPVLVNARAAARPELGGVERWAREMEARLPALGDYQAVAPPPALSHRAGHAWEQGVLPALARRAPLLVNPANLAPVAFPRNLVVLHDLAALREPGWYSPLYVRWQRTIAPLVARRARVVVTVSAFSRAELADLLGVDAVVVPGGVDERFRPDAEPYAHPRPYVLTVASRTARKNLAALADTAARLRRLGVDLLAAGGGRPQFAAEAPVPGVTVLGHVDDADLPGLYAGAQAFVLPSLYEGFGLTVLEAMACGAPVVAADRGALPETVGDAGVLVDPLDPPAIAAAVERALGDPRLRAAGPARAAAFTWDAAARRMDALVRGVGAGHGSGTT